MLTYFADLRSFENDRIKKTLTSYENSLSKFISQATYYKVSENETLILCFINN